MKRLLPFFLLFAGAPSANATTQQFQFTGFVDLVEGDAPGADITIGAHLQAAFQFDAAEASAPTIVSIGGGEHSIYAAPLRVIQITIGSYSVVFSQKIGNLVYMDNAWGQDGIVFALSGLPGGPFSSEFATIQFQARGANDVIDPSGLGNGLPFEQMDLRFFASFGSDVASKRIFGTLTATIASVPESETWVFFICGFALAGACLRQARRVDRYTI